MKIRLAILETDRNYLDRITSVFTSKFADKLEVYSFSEEALAMAELLGSKIDVFLAGASFDIDVRSIPQRCAFAYLVDSADIQTYKGQQTVSKFQKAELIYKAVLNIYAENAGNVVIGLNPEGESPTKIIAFVSASGGAGSSSLAAACAANIARRGKSALYLNVEQFGSSNLFFNGPGQFTFSDVIYAVKSKKANLALKLQSAVKQDESGVYFYDSAPIALDIAEISGEDFETLCAGLLAAGYSHIILDMDFSLSKRSIEQLKVAHALIFVSDGSEIANLKFERALAAMTVLDQQADLTLCRRIALMYNRFSSKTGRMIENSAVPMLGGAPKFEQATTRQILEKLTEMPLFDKLI